MAAKAPRGPIGFRLAHELDGLLSGISADGVINADETARVRRWLEANEPYADVRPFSELAGHLTHALSDGVVTPEECADLLFVVRKYTVVNPYFDALRAGLQALMGLLAGLAADQRLEDAEARALSKWLEEWAHLVGLWPYDECNAIVTSMLSRGFAADDAQRLLSMAEDFPVAGEPPRGDTPPALIGGVCMINPRVTFRDKHFVFTGESPRCPRSAMESHVLSNGGWTDPNVRKDTDYLIVGSAGSEHWAFCCYGRKVEKAYQMRRAGHPIALIHERDFWDAAP